MNLKHPLVLALLVPALLLIWLMHTLDLEKVIVLTQLPAQKRDIKVLFVGNHYTSLNEMPAMLEQIAASDKSGGGHIETGEFAFNNATLESLWKDGKSQGVLHGKKWDYVVLQEHADQPLRPEWIPIMHQFVAKWNEAIRDAGAGTVLFEVWARGKNSPLYDPAVHPRDHFVSPAFSLMQIDRVNEDIASRTGAAVVPVGDYWMQCAGELGTPDLFQSEDKNVDWRNSLPSVAGSYYTALLFYKYLTGHDVRNVAYVAPGLSPADGEALKKCAALKPLDPAEVSKAWMKEIHEKAELAAKRRAATLKTPMRTRTPDL